MSKTYTEFYQSIGLKEFPFNTFTTENEINIAKKVFVPQGEYGPILDSFRRGQNIIILGERGSGKTAILEDFKRFLERNKKPFTIIIDFSNLSKIPSEEEIYKIIISQFSIELFTSVGRNPLRLFKLNNEEKNILSYFLATFLPSVSLNNLRDRVSSIQTPIWSRIGSKLYNLIRGPLNFAGTVGQNLTYQYLLKHYSFLPPIESDNQIQEFFPELKLDVNYEFFDQDISLRLLKRLGGITLKLGYSKPVILFDRFDEDSRFQDDANIISDFLKPFLINNNLLSLSEFQIISFIWSTPFRFISEFVRSQKYYCPSLSWRRTDLEKLINKRLSVHSDNKVNNYKTLFSEEVCEDDISEIFKLSNSNPRDLIHLFRIVLEEQYRSNSDAIKITKNNFHQGLKRFVLEFDYYEYYPRKSNARANSMDIYSYATHLLKLDSDVFTKNQLNEKAGTGSSTNNYVVSMERIGLIENIEQEKGHAKYQIKDPKIVYCQRHDLELRR